MLNIEGLGTYHEIEVTSPLDCPENSDFFILS